jgi:hypothetical protein
MTRELTRDEIIAIAERTRKLSRDQLIAIAERLMNDKSLSRAEADQLTREFEDNTLFPDSGNLIFLWRHEFKDAAELVDYALGREKAKKLSRDELIAVATRLMAADIANPVQSGHLGRLFNETGRT